MVLPSWTFVRDGAALPRGGRRCDRRPLVGL